MRVHTKETQSHLTPRMALDILKEGNDRFIRNLKAQRDLLAQVNDTRDGQWPRSNRVQRSPYRSHTQHKWNFSCSGNVQCH